MWQLAIDFDGTIVEHAYPAIGAEVPGAVLWINRFKKVKAQITLWTMRSGPELAMAVTWMKERGIAPDYANYQPEDRTWTASPKVFAHCYIDDAAFGCPVITPIEPGRRKYADWSIIGPAVLERISA